MPVVETVVHSAAQVIKESYLFLNEHYLQAISPWYLIIEDPADI